LVLFGEGFMGEIEANYGLLKEGILRKSKAKGWFFLG